MRLGSYIRGQVDENVTLTALPSKDVIGGNFGETANERTFVSSLVAKYALSNVTKGLDDGPIMLGVAHADYSDAEIEAWIENSASWHSGDLVQQEITKRKIRQLGIFEMPIDANDTVLLNHGRPIKTKLNWMLQSGQTLKLWGYNMGNSNFATTNPVVRAIGHVNLWQK